MDMPNEHRNAEYTDGPASFSHDPASVMSLWDEPSNDADMFTRWIELSDAALCASSKATKKTSSRSRRNSGFSCWASRLDLKCQSAGQAKPAGARKAVPISR